MDTHAKLEQLHETACVLHDDVTHLESVLDTLTPDTPEAISKERVLNVKWRLYTETRDQIDRLEDRLAIEWAQAHWHWHEQNDTLDLY